ncbi:hypothetical protein MHB56_00585 [Paenibacillus sp. FSL H8-0315]
MSDHNRLLSSLITINESGPNEYGEIQEIYGRLLHLYIQSYNLNVL